MQKEKSKSKLLDKKVRILKISKYIFNYNQRAAGESHSKTQIKHLKAKAKQSEMKSKYFKLNQNTYTLI